MTLTQPHPPPTRRFPVRRVVSVVLMVAGLAVAGFGLFASCQQAQAGEVFLDPAASPGLDPFFGGGTVTAAPPGPKVALPQVARPAGGQGVPAVAGTTPGLYGGVENQTLCNTAQIIGYLETTPDRAGPWTEALGIAPGGIRAFLTGLTPVVLRVDTRVTSIGFRGGRAVPTQAVLETGTVVLVDAGGQPRVRCGSGNPLDRPRSVRTGGDGTRFAGTPWPGFSPTTIVVITPTAPIGAIILVDLRGGVTIVRVPGSPDVVIPQLPPLLRPGDPVAVAGRGFPPGTRVTITYDDPALTLATVAADGAGNVSTNVAIPAASTRGLHVVTATGGGVTNLLYVYVLPPL
ncbi:MAG: DUF6777 domain-containing protein [Pseudonocardia sp.]